VNRIGQPYTTITNLIGIVTQIMIWGYKQQFYPMNLGQCYNSVMEQDSKEVRAKLPKRDVAVDSDFDTYLKLLNINSEQSPHFPHIDELPGHIYLPPEILGSIYSSIKSTKRDKKERSQYVYWNKRIQNYSPGKIFTGNYKGTNLLENLPRILNLAYGKPLLYSHTHPDSSWGFSNTDIAMFIAHPSDAYIYAVGSHYALSVIFQTQEMLNRKRGIGNIAYIIEMLKLNNIDGKGTRLEEAGSKIAGKYLWSQGIPLYVFLPPYRDRFIADGTNVPVRFVAEEDFKNGVLLEREMDHFNK